MNNKEKNTRLVTFKEAYNSKAGTAAGKPPIYKKGSTHAIHKDLVKKLQEKGAKIEVKPLDTEAMIRRIKARKAANLKKAEAKAI
jgi:hypothetical protein